MEVFCSLFFFGLLAFSLIFVFKFFNHQRRCSKAFTYVGERFNKSSNAGVSYSMLFSSPMLTFPYRNTMCQLRMRRSRAFETPHVTELKIRMGDPLPDFEITTGEFTNRIFQREPKTRITLDDPQLKDHFKAAAEQVDAIKLLSNPVCWQLEELRRHAQTFEVAVNVRRGVMTIKKPCIMTAPQQLDDFVRFSLKLYDQMVLAKAQGIEFVNDQCATVVDDVKCPICSEEIVHDMVVCTRCKTPHCRDCWQYNGQCATFACAETRFLQIG